MTPRTTRVVHRSAYTLVSSNQGVSLGHVGGITGQADTSALRAECVLDPGK